MTAVVEDARLALVHPEFRRRNAALVGACWARGWHIEYVRVTADIATQRALRKAYVNRLRSIPAADPDVVGGLCPDDVFLTGGRERWRLVGSYHQVQADGWSHAIDYGIEGCTWPEFHALAHGFGLRFPLASWSVYREPWHGQWWDTATGIYPAPLLPPPPLPAGDDDMPARLIIPDDGDPAVFVTDGVIKTWVRDGDALAHLRDEGFVQARTDGTPWPLRRSAIESLALVGPAPIYDPMYQGPRSTR